MTGSHPGEAPARRPARLLRRRRPRRADGRARARALRRARLRAQGDRPQQARGRAAARRGARCSSSPRPRCPRARRSSSPPTASRRACTPTPRERDLHTIDATCPLVTKVHVEAKKFAAEGYTIVLIGHAGHEEVEGTMGEAPGAHRPDRGRGRRRRSSRSTIPSKVAYISQTTLSVDETRAIINRLRERFPAIIGPRTDDICYATTNRQAAVKQLARESDLVLVIGSRNSSNSNRLVEVAREHGADSLPDRQRGPGARGVAGGQARGRHHLRRQRARGARAAAGRASSARRGTEDVQELEVVQEDVRFMLPKVIRQAMAAGRLTVALRRARAAHAGRLRSAPRGRRPSATSLRDPEPRAALLRGGRRRATGWCCSATCSSCATGRRATRWRRARSR